MSLSTALLLAFAAASVAQHYVPPPPSTWPQEYPGIPSGAYGPDWQYYFEVTKPLPNVTWPMPRSYAGNIPVDRPGHPNDTLFFWGVESWYGSITTDDSEEPWLIWLNGGPGASSFLGFMLENGPIHVTNTYAIVDNPYSWNQLLPSFWVDQPVGTGFSTADADGYIANEDQMGADFLGFLRNLVAVFPSLAYRPLYLTGESYAGTYIPYITKAIFSDPNPPVKLHTFAIGDGAIGSLAEFEMFPTTSIIETYPQLINFDPDVYEYFKEQNHLCGYDLNFTYPEKAPFPTLANTLEVPATCCNNFKPSPSDPPQTEFEDVLARTATRESLAKRAKNILSRKNLAALEHYKKRSGDLYSRELLAREEKRQAWKREVSELQGRLNPYYGCYTLYELADYAENYTFPWSVGAIDYYDIPDALNPEAPADASVFMNAPETREAIHAPTMFDWEEQVEYPFNSSYITERGSNQFGDPSVEPAAFLTELAWNASIHGVRMVFYSGNDDALVAHRSTEGVIQNMTFGGIQGFTRPPSTPWYDFEGVFSGIVHQERNVTYVLVDNAGHEVPEYNPAGAWSLLQDFILGTSQTGYVIPGTDIVIGGEDPSLVHGILTQATHAIYYGPGTTVSSTAWPAATIAAWDKFVATAIPTGAP